MAQYGRSLYATSPYGYGIDSSNRIYGGVFVGEFESDETNIHYSIKGLNAPINLKATLEVPWAQYSANSTNETGEWQFESGWNVTNSSAEYSRTTTGEYKKAILTSTISDCKFEFAKNSTATVKINVFDMIYDSTEGIAKIGTTPYKTIEVNTNTTKIVNINNMPYGEKVIEISHKEETTGVISLVSARCKTAYIAFEIRRKVGNEWKPWDRVNTISTYKSDLEVEFNGTQGATGETQELKGYQFRIILMSSDNLVAPAISKLAISVGNVDRYDTEGFYRMLIDLESFGGHRVKSIDNVTCEFEDEMTLETNSPTTRCEVRTATSSNSNPSVDNVNMWSAWTPPYGRITDRRVMLNLKQNQDLTDGFIIMKPVKPQIDSTNSNYNKIVSWKNSYIHYNVQQYNPLDPVFSTLNNLSTISVKCVKNNESKSEIPIRRNENGTVNTQIDYTKNGINNIDISGVEGENIRLKINLRRKLPIGTQLPSTPYIDLARLSVEMDYTEKISFTDKPFNEPTRNYNGFASAVFNQCTGVEKIHVDGKKRSVAGSIPYFKYTLPKVHIDGSETVVDGITYTISNTKLDKGISSQISLYWDNEKDNKAMVTTNASSTLMSQVLPTYDPDNNVFGNQNVMPICYQNRYGLTTKLASPDIDSYDIDIVNNLFSPKIKTDKEYMYYLDTVSPDNVDMLFMSEKDKSKNVRTNLSYQPTSNNPVTVGINIEAPREGGLTEWFSSEIISEKLTVNPNGEYIPKMVTIGDDAGELPQIPGEITIGPNPYIVEVLKGSVECDGISVEDSRISLLVQKINRNLTEEKYVPMFTSGSLVDPLPRGRCKRVEFYADVDDKPGTKLTHQFEIIKDEGETLFGSKVRWTGTSKPAANSKIWCIIEYEKAISIDCLIRSDYKEKEYSYANIYRTEPKKYSAEVTPTMDYESKEFIINDEWEVPSHVDKTSLELKVQAINNKNVRCYVNKNKVYATLDGTDALINWHPDVKKGYYYSRKKEGYLYTSMRQIELNDDTIPKAKNIEYVKLSDTNSAIAVQEPTVNILSNSNLLSLNNTIDTILIDNFNDIIGDDEEAVG